MADFRNFQLTAQADASLTVARINIEATVVDSTTGAVIADFTGANAVQFAIRVPGFTAAQHRAIAEQLARDILHMKAGV
jgi:hypothetical protein